MSLLGSAAKYFAMIKAARDIANMAKKIGIGDLRKLVDGGRSITDVYLESCSPTKKAKLKQDAHTLFEMGITPEMLWDEVTGQMPDLASIIEGKDAYVKTEMQRIKEFLEGEY